MKTTPEMLPDKKMRRRLTRALLAAPAASLLAACAGKRGAPPSLPRPTNLISNNAKQRWSTRIGGGGYGFVPAIYDGRVWAASNDGELIGLDGSSGKKVVSVDTGVRFSSGVATDGTVLVLADDEGRLHGFETDGAARWTVDLKAEAASVPAAGAGMAVVRLSDNSVAAYDLADGSVRWRYTRRNPSLVLRQTSQIAMDPGSAYVGLPGGRIVALSLSNGSSRWESGISLPRGSNEIERVADVVSMPVLNGSSLCAAAYQGRVTCIDRDSGRALWSENLKAGSGADLDASRILVSDVDGKLHAYDRGGKPIWTQEALRGRGLGAPTLHQDKVWIGDANGYLHILDANTGDITGRAETDGSQIFAAPLPLEGGDSSVVIQTAAGTVTSIGA